MKNSTKKTRMFVLNLLWIAFIFLSFLFMAHLPNAYAQHLDDDILRASKSIDDVLRYSVPDAIISPRVAALGFSYYGISDDASAMLFNPAGLSLIHGYELGAGFNFNNSTVETNFLNTSKKQSNTEPYFSNIQIAFPMQASFGNLLEPLQYTIAFGYSLENDFSSNCRWGAFNPQNSFISEQALKKAHWLNATKLLDTTFITNITGDVQQEGRVIEEGGLHNLTFGIALDISPSLSIGGSLITKIGTYQYRKVFMESDILNIYNEYLVDDFNSLVLNYNLLQDIAAVTGAIGMQFKLEDWFRAGFSVKFPTYTYISEEHRVNIHVQYDPDPNSGIAEYGNYDFSSTDYYSNYSPKLKDYYINSPFEFSFGASANFFSTTVSVAASYKSLSSSSVEHDFGDIFDRYNYEYNYFFTSDSLNDAISKHLSNYWIFGIGAEHKLQNLPIYLRASYTGISSPYANSNLGSFKHIVGAGFSLIIMKNFSIESAFVYKNYTYRNTNYGSDRTPDYYSHFDAKFNSINYAIGFRYRY